MLERRKAKKENETLLSRAMETISKYSSTIRELEDIVKRLQKENEKLREQLTVFKRQLQRTEPKSNAAGDK